jgi:hypothetical protein
MKFAHIRVSEYFTQRRRISLKKALAEASAFLCEEAHKRCVSVGKNAKKVRKCR